MVKTHNNLSLSGSSLTINAGDTLVIMGSLTVSALSGISNNGLLVVLGSVSDGLSSIVTSATGKFVVTGNYTTTLSTNTFTGPSYVYGSTSGFLIAPPVTTQAGLVSGDPSLYSFVNYMYGVLPVQLLSFSADVNNQQIIVTWKTFSETNNDYFILERSEAKNNFKTIATIRVAGSSNEVEEYEFMDSNPLSGLIYYRLSQVDENGKLTRLSIISVNTGETVSIEIYPNPVGDYLFITGIHENSGISIKDIKGTYPSTSYYQVSELAPGKTGIKVSDLEAGVYCIRISNTINNTSTTLKFIKL